MKSNFLLSIRRTAMKVRNRCSKFILIMWILVTLANVLAVKNDLLAGTLDFYSQISILLCIAGFFILGSRTTM